GRLPCRGGAAGADRAAGLCAMARRHDERAVPLAVRRPMRRIRRLHPVQLARRQLGLRRHQRADARHCGARAVHLPAQPAARDYPRVAGVRRARKDAANLSFALAALGRDAAQTIDWGSWMMATGRYSPAEYRRMTSEKYHALVETGLALSQTLPAAAWS